MTTPRSGRSRYRLIGGGLAAVAFGVVLSACGTSGTGLAQEACHHIDRSITLLARAGKASDATEAADLRQKAYVQLRDALPIAAEAAYADGQYQALMTTVAESSRVSETTLVPALQAQCQQTDSTPFGQSPAPSSIPPPAPVSSTP